MNLITIVCIALIAIMAIFQLNHITKRKKISDHLVELVTQQKFSELYDAVNQPTTIKYIPEYNRHFLCMNAALIENNNERIIHYFDLLSKLNLNSAQKKAVYMRGLQYFIATQDTAHCKMCYEALKGMEMDESTKQYLDEINDILILKNTDKLNDLLSRIESNSSNEVFIDEFLVAEIYRNMHNDDKFNEYSNKAKQHMEKYINLAKHK